jgi:hypothetical protein
VRSSIYRRTRLEYSGKVNYLKFLISCACCCHKCANCCWLPPRPGFSRQRDNGGWPRPPHSKLIDPLAPGWRFPLRVRLRLDRFLQTCPLAYKVATDASSSSAGGGAPTPRATRQRDPRFHRQFVYARRSVNGYVTAPLQSAHRFGGVCKCGFQAIHSPVSNGRAFHIGRIVSPFLPPFGCSTPARRQGAHPPTPAQCPAPDRTI